MLYNLLLTLHISAVGALLFAVGAEYCITREVFRQEFSADVRNLARLPKWEWVNIAAVVLILLTGFLMVFSSAAVGLGAAWVWVAIALTLGYTAFAGVTGERVKNVVQGELAEPDRRITPQLERAALWSVRVSIVGLPATVGLFVLMVFKPELIAAALAVAVVSVAIGFAGYGLFMAPRISRLSKQRITA